MTRFSDHDIEKMLRGEGRVDPPTDLLEQLRAEIPEDFGAIEPATMESDTIDPESSSPDADDLGAHAGPRASARTGSEGRDDNLPGKVLSFPRMGRRILLAAAAVIFTAGASLLTFRVLSPESALSGLSEKQMAEQQVAESQAAERQVKKDSASVADSEPSLRANTARESASRQDSRRRRAAPSARGSSAQKPPALKPSDQKSSAQKSEDGDLSGAFSHYASADDVAELDSSPAAEESIVRDLALGEVAMDASAVSEDENLIAAGGEAQGTEEKILEPAARTEEKPAKEEVFLPAVEARSVADAPAAPREAEPRRESVDRSSAHSASQWRVTYDAVREVESDSPYPESETARVKRHLQEARPAEGQAERQEPDGRQRAGGDAGKRKAPQEDQLASHLGSSLWRHGSPWSEALDALEEDPRMVIGGERLDLLRAAVDGHPRLEKAGYRLLEAWRVDPSKRAAVLAPVLEELRTSRDDGVADAAKMIEMAELLGGN